MIEPLSQQIEFSVILPFRDALPELRACLDAVVREVQEYGLAEVIAVNNGSVDSSAAVIENYPTIQLLSTPERTIGGARNAGAAVARGTWLYFLDADCVVASGQLARAKSVFRETGCSATGCKVGLGLDPSCVERAWVEMHRPTFSGPVSYINSGNLFVQSSAFREIGGFDESLITGEDSELGLRLNNGGHTVLQSTLLSVSHLRNPTTLRAFVGKEIWHGLGMLGTAVGPTLNRPTAMLFVHLMLVTGSFVALFYADVFWIARVGIVLVGNAIVPIASVLYRFSRNGVRGNPIPRITLYWLYYLARSIALVRIMVGRATAPRS